MRKAWFKGSCGCAGGANGNPEFSYAAITNTNTSGYDAAPALRTMVERPDGSFLTQYFDETGQALSQVISDSDPSTGSPSLWITKVTRDSTGCVTSVTTPENSTAYTHSTGAITASTSAGLIQHFTRASSGDTTGFMTERKHSVGTSGTAYFDEKLTYDATTLAKTITDVTVRRPVVTSRKSYPTEVSTDTGSEETTYSYTVWSGAALSPEKIEVTPPAVDTTKNGSGSAIVSSSHLRKDGLVDFEKRPTVLDNGTASYLVAYSAYDKGQVTRSIVDADTSSGDVTVTVPTGFSSDSGATKVAKKTDTTYTASGLKDEVTPAGTNNKVEKQYLSKLADERLVVLNYAAVGAGDFYGPVSYQVVNQAGKTEVSGVIAVVSDKNNTAQSAHIDEASADPITAIDTGSGFGSLATMSTMIYDESGTMLKEERRYFLLPSTGAGTEGTNYDSTRHGYDDEGHRVRVKEASGTIRRTTFDLFGRSIDQYVGTNDHSFTGGEASGTDNMVKTEHLAYDGGSAGLNGRLTSRTAYVEDSTTGQRVTTFEYDSRGRRILDLPPLAPFTVTKYDNHNRSIATAQYSSSSGLTTSTDPTSTSTNRMTLSETLFDEASRAWKTIRHKIGTSGSDDGTLVARSWYDQLGQVVKVNNQGALKKTRYDRLGRVTDEFILAVDNDTAYADADDVAADIVLEQHQTRYDPVLDTVTFSATISRLKTDVSTGETTGALDTNADAEARKLTAADVKGRMMVTGYWYDRTKRQKDRCEFGTNGGATLDFTTGMGTPPARSDTALVTSTLYNIDGTVDTVTDPMAHVAKSIYDALGRRTKEIRNYDVGVNSGNPSGTDDNVTVLYTYSSGLRTALTADLPSGSTDQVTTYTYGTTKGTSAGDSKIATGHLLQKVTYPDSSGSTDVVTSAYNAQSQEMWKKDQAGTIHEFDFDTRGRKTQDRVTTLASGFDGAVRRIATTYDGLGRTELVTQVDNATVGSGTVVDEVKYTYEGWGNVSKFEQDRDSAVGASGSVNDYEVSYTYAAATTGRNTIRKTQMVLPGGDYVGYDYSAAGGSHDNEVSRVTTLFNVSRITYAQYAYNGVGQVVGTEYPEPAVMWNQYSGSGTSATFPDFDDFNRVKRSRWTKDLATDIDFYHVELTYDRNSNITSADDQVHTGFDVKYMMDDIDRLTRAEEGTLSSGSITSRSRDQEWTLGQTGNWDNNKVDLNGDGDYVDTDEENDTRAHNPVNEISTRKSATVTLAYDAPGNLTDDGVDYEYVWDAWNRMREVRNTTTQALIAEYRYNGLGYRIGEHVDTDTDNDVDGSDLWYYDAFDENWRQVARFRSSDTSPKEQFVAHQAGLDGSGGSSYIDLVACRNKDKDTAWTIASDGVLEERVYYCQNWRAGVSALVKADGTMLEWVKYSAYGVTFGLPNGDSDSDGDCDSNDSNQITAWYILSAYDVRGDIDLDGDVDLTDVSLMQTGSMLGRGMLSAPTVNNSRGLQAAIQVSGSMNLSRRRLTSPVSGRWNSRDELGYADGPNSYESVRGNPLSLTDPFGLLSFESGPGREPGGCVLFLPEAKRRWVAIIYSTTSASGWSLGILGGSIGGQITANGSGYTSAKGPCGKCDSLSGGTGNGPSTGDRLKLKVLKDGKPLTKGDTEAYEEWHGGAGSTWQPMQSHPQTRKDESYFGTP